MNLHTAIEDTPLNQIETVTVVPAQRLDAFSAPELRTDLDELIKRGVHDFVVDLSDTDFLDSAGMAALVSLLKQARRQGGDVKLIWPRREPVQRILRLTRFDRVFEILPAA